MAQTRWMTLVVAMLMLAMVDMAWGQGFGGPGGGQGGGPGRGPGGGPGGQGGPGNFDPAQMRQMMADRMRQALGASDEEWKVLQPKLDAVQKAQQDTRGGGGFMGGRGGPGGPGGGNPQDQSAMQIAARDLRQAIDNQGTTSAEIQQKLATYREARTAARKKLLDAQTELLDLLTKRQEAALVSMGMLE